VLHGKRIKALRAKRGLTQRALADAIKRDQGYIYRLEHDHYKDVSVRTLEALANALGVSTDYLLGRTDDDESEPADLALVDA
jgi:transcriptional regulator with XRE-family HTH domain